MDYNYRVEAAVAAIKQHNEQVGNEGEGWVSPDKFVAKVKALGGTSDNRLADLSHEDLHECMIGNNGYQLNPVPRVLAKGIAKLFRAKDGVEGPFDSPQQLIDSLHGRKPVSAKKAASMTPLELVGRYDPNDPTNPVGERLKKISKGKPFLVYNEDGGVHVKVSICLLDELVKGYPPLDDYLVGEQVRPTYRVGDLPAAYADEDPIWHERPLRPDGTCDQTGRSWEGVPLAMRQLAWLAVDLGELKADIDSAHAALDLCLSDASKTKASQRWRKAAVKFQELAKTGGLPVLKVRLGQEEAKGNGPFAGGDKVQFIPIPAPIPQHPYHLRPQIGHWVNKTPHITWTSNIGGYYADTANGWVWRQQ